MASPNLALGRELARQHVQHYGIAHRIISAISRQLDRITYTQRHGLIAGMRRRGGLGWVPFGFDTPELKFWRQLDLSGKTVWDVGAYQGLLTLHFARQASAVIAFEPLAGTRQRLRENIALNGLANVVVREAAIGAARGTAVIAVDPTQAGGASLDAEIQTGIAGEQHRVDVSTIDSEAEMLPIPDLVKIDIEGYEAQALRGGRNTITSYHPDLYLEMHGETMEQKHHNVAEIVRLLEEYGYGSIAHVESGTRITSSNSMLAAQGHLWATTRDAVQSPSPAQKLPNPTLLALAAICALAWLIISCPISWRSRLEKVCRDG